MINKAMSAIKRNMYIQAITSSGQFEFEGKQVYDMNEKELKLALTLIKRGLKT